jgi:hypothetical protein
MKALHYFFITTILFAAAALPAQDFGFGGPESAAKEASGSASGAAPGAPAATFSGELLFDARSYVDAADPASSALESFGQAKAGVTVKGKAVEAVLKLKLNPEMLASKPSRVLDEASILAFLGDSLELKAGLVKLTWGKGDSLHVLDVVNPTDYSDFINPGLEDMKMAQALVKLDLRTSATGKLELVYLPGFEGDALPLAGRWAPKEYVDSLADAKAGFYYGSNPAANGGKGNGVYYSYWLNAYSVAYALSLSQAAAAAAADAQAALIAAQAGAQAQALADGLMVLPETRTLKWSQGGLRFTESLLGMDLGIQYYTGFLKTPVYDPDPARIPLDGNHVLVGYDRYHQLGIDAAFVLLGFNLRAEAAYNLTADTDGSDRLVQNPFLAWTAGFDRDIVGISVNLQTQGSWMLFHGETVQAYDVQAGKDELESLLALRIGRKFLNDRVELEAVGSYDLVHEDYLVYPTLSYYPADDLAIKLSGKYFGGGAGTRLGQYGDDSFVELSMSYTF